MIDLFNTDYKDYKDGCAALHKIHRLGFAACYRRDARIRVEKRKSICVNLFICENLCNLWLKT
jgi:hypothetical protein